MKTSFLPASLRASPGRHLPPAVVRLLSPVLLLASVLPAPAANEAGKPYTLFLSTEFSVPQDKEYHRVLDVVGGMFVIRVKEQEVRIPMRTGSGNLKVDQGLRLTALHAQVDHLVTERAYTEANDPTLQFNSRAGAVLGSDAYSQNANITASVTASNEVAAGEALASAQAYGDPTRTEQAANFFALARAKSLTAAADAENSSYNLKFSGFNNPGFAAFELQQELAKENFDAMRYSFQVSSATPLNSPYLVFIVRYHEKDAKPGTKEGTVIYAKSIAPIGDKPSKINILQSGMPVGFVVDDCQVRLYNGGQEVATNVAPRRVPMSRDEAFLYLKIDRLGRAKGATLPAAPALGRLDEETKARLTLDQLKQIYYVKVTKEGRAEQAFLDAACTQPADPTVAAVVADIRFYPALEKNQEQAGTAKLQFSQIPI